MSGSAPGKGDAARRYLREGAIPPTKMATVSWATMPSLFKVYRGATRIALPFPIRPVAPCPLSRSTIGDLAGNLIGLVRVEWMPDQAMIRRIGIDPPAVSIVSSVSMGRPTPSGGRLYPSELYVANRPLPDLPAGLYHYAPGLHALESLLVEDVRKQLMNWLAMPPEPDPDLVLVFTSVFWRNAFKYLEFAYRLQALEAGAMAGQSLVLAEAAGLAATLHLDFVDTQIDRTLGVDPSRESCSMVVTIAARDGKTASTVDSLPPVGMPTLMTVLEGPTRDAFPLTAAIHVASTNEQPLRPVEVFADYRVGKLPVLAWTKLPMDLVRLMDGISRRRSSVEGYRPEAIAAVQLSAMLTAAVAHYSSDMAGTAECVEHTVLYLVVNRVRDVAPGLYRYDTRSGRLGLLREGAIFPVLAPHLGLSLTGAFEASVVYFPVGDFERGFPIYGDRWYWMQNLECGLVAERICLAAAALGLGSHIRCDYDVAGITRLLGLDSEAQTALVMILVGPSREPAPLFHQLTMNSPREVTELPAEARS